MSLIPRTCETCRYAEPYNADYVYCKRYPPGGDFVSVFGLSLRKREFPIVHKDVWCGEHNFKLALQKEPKGEIKR